MKEDKLALGCGTNNHGKNYRHLDLSNLDHVDEQHDLETGKLPYESNEFNKVKAIHILEHLTKESLISIMKEISRVTKPKGIIEIAMPHFLSVHAKDIDHERSGSKQSFIQFCEKYPMNSPYPTLFKQKNIEHILDDKLLVNISRKVLGYKATAKYLPNSVKEIRYELINL